MYFKIWFAIGIVLDISMFLFHDYLNINYLFFYFFLICMLWSLMAIPALFLTPLGMRDDFSIPKDKKRRMIYGKNNEH